MTGQLLGFLLLAAVVAVLYVGNCWLHRRARLDETAPFQQSVHVRVRGGGDQ